LSARNDRGFSRLVECHNCASFREKQVMTAMAEDDDLLGRFVAGDADAFVVFYRRHLPAIVAFFLRRTGDREVTADLTAEVFAAALLAVDRYEPGERPALAWLYGIAAHKLSDSRRKGRVEDLARRRLSLEPLALNDSSLEQVEVLASRGGDESRIVEAVERLPAAQRDAVLARVVQERSYREIARAMSCSEMVVRQRVSRGLRAIRSEMRNPDE
jgi:RNA polymerase sigma factor (sigma-70 family)